MELDVWCLRLELFDVTMDALELGRTDVEDLVVLVVQRPWQPLGQLHQPRKGPGFFILDRRRLAMANGQGVWGTEGGQQRCLGRKGDDEDFGFHLSLA